jgi:hypothetical protein
MTSCGITWGKVTRQHTHRCIRNDLCHIESLIGKCECACGVRAMLK